MVTMIDEIYDRNYQVARTELGAALAHGIAKFGHAVGNAFKVLNRIEYQAPWAARPKQAK